MKSLKSFAHYLPAALIVMFILFHPSLASALRIDDPPANVPEIDPAMAVGALALLGGTITIIRGRTKAKK